MEKICPICGYVGIARKHGGEQSTVIHIVLFMFTLGLGNLIYMVYLNSAPSTVCPQCKGSDMLPVYSPMGQDYLKRFQEFGKYPAYPASPPPAPIALEPVPAKPYAPAAEEPVTGEKRRSYVPLLSLLFIVCLLAVLGMIDQEHRVATGQYAMDAANKAQAACNAFNGTGMVRNCQADSISRVITVTIDTTFIEADKICRNSASQMSQAGYDMERDWRLRIKSPLPKDMLLASCDL